MLQGNLLYFVRLHVHGGSVAGIGCMIVFCKHMKLRERVKEILAKYSEGMETPMRLVVDSKEPLKDYMGQGYDGTGNCIVLTTKEVVPRPPPTPKRG